MNRRTFIQGLIGLASMPMIAKYINVFKPAAVREGITQAADNTMQKGIEFYEAVIKRVIDEGTMVSESDRTRRYIHPDKPDINVELDLTSGDTAVFFETDKGSRGMAGITTDMEMGPGAPKELVEHEEVYRMGRGDDYYKDIDEEITGGVGSLEEWIKMKRGYAGGGRVGMWEGGSLDYLDLIGDELSADEWEGILQALGVYDERFLDYKKGGRVGMWKGGMPKGLAAALRTIRAKFGKGAIHQADEVVVDGDIYKAADPNRPPTEVEIETKYEELMDPDGGLPYYTIGELDNALVEARAYEKEMFRQYKSGELDKYVKPEVLEESRTAFQNKINNQLEKTYDDIAGGSGFTGDDYKYDAQILADGIVEDLGLVWDNLSNERQAQIYNAALARISKDMAMKRALRKASKPTKTLEGIKETGTINISDPNVAEEFARFMREVDPKGAKKIDQTVELMNFDPKGRKKNAKGGHIKDDADVSLTIIEIPDISESGVESLFKRR